MQNKPAYGIDSVDHALQLAAILQQEGALRVTDAAERLGVARSTAHRLLAMLVYRGFAEQNVDRHYLAGPILRLPAAAEPVAELRRVALPHLQALSAWTTETVNLVVVVEEMARFVATVEGTQVLRVGNREGRMLPAHLASGGRAVLATRSEEEVHALYSVRDSTVLDLDALLKDLRRVRRQGFAINDQGTEIGVTAIGQAVRGPTSEVKTAVSIAMPTARYRRDRLVEWVQRLAATVKRIEQGIESTTLP
ncbi:MAG: IclR family transcriptional regulator [Rhodococcus sp. (in: high G+C Gram-positive bacteria)]|nr:MAG: IclR family transcriptional regulator [Rhodococcus sp. (in: high G+C Gram-positive bacteria)]